MNENNGILIGTTPAGVQWVCYEPKTLEMMKEAFEKTCRHQIALNCKRTK